MSDKDYTEPIINECGGYYCDERVGHVDCKAPHGNARLFLEQQAEIERLTAQVDAYQRGAESQERARLADACSECHGLGERGWTTETELGPEGDSQECEFCFGSGSQAMADKISAFIESETGAYEARQKELEDENANLKTANNMQTGMIEQGADEVDTLTAIINGDTDLRFIKRLLEANAQYASQVNDLNAECALLHDANAQAESRIAELEGVCRLAYSAIGFPIDDEGVDRVTNALAAVIRCEPFTALTSAATVAADAGDSPEGAFLPPSVAVGEPDSEKG